MLRGAMRLEYMEDGRRREQIVRKGVTMHVADIERQLKAAIEHFDVSLAPLVAPVTPGGPPAWSGAAFGESPQTR
jgi:hypothetical protein